MRHTLQRCLLAGNMPYFAVFLLCASAWALGLLMRAPPAARIAIAERGAVVLEAVLEMPQASTEELRARIEAPTRSVLQKYRDQGYLVIDASRDEAGHLLVAALPASALDITAELRAAVHSQLAAQETKPGAAP